MGCFHSRFCGVGRAEAGVGTSIKAAEAKVWTADVRLTLNTISSFKIHGSLYLPAPSRRQNVQYSVKGRSDVRGGERDRGRRERERLERGGRERSRCTDTPLVEEAGLQGFVEACA